MLVNANLSNVILAECVHNGIRVVYRTVNVVAHVCACENVPDSGSRCKVTVSPMFTNKYTICFLVEEEAYAQVSNNNLLLYQ